MMNSSSTTLFSTLEEKINNALVIDKEKGIYWCNRAIFTDESLFELEMKAIFEGNWIYLAHKSQIAEPGDYYTLTMGCHAYHYYSRSQRAITRDDQ